MARRRREDSRAHHQPPHPNHHDNEGISAADILAGATIPIRMDVRYEITRGDPEELRRMAPPGLAERLLKNEDRILGWLSESEANRVAFLTDPLGALTKIGVKLELPELEALRRVHAETAAFEVLPPGVEIGQLKVDLAPKGRDHRATHAGTARTKPASKSRTERRASAGRKKSR
jgi:hypothetical protein